jgi:hypothetical protein
MSEEVEDEKEKIEVIENERTESDESENACLDEN